MLKISESSHGQAASNGQACGEKRRRRDKPMEGLVMKGLRWCLASSALLFPVAMAEATVPLSSMGAVGQAITACWKPPADITKSAVTLAFSLKRDGSLIGKPRPTAININGDADVRKRFIEAAIDAVIQCTPVELSADLAQGIGGQVFTLVFASPDQPAEMTPDN
ncbi:MAG: hypothetical protein ABWZ57_15815 [Mesorhizobium sp.]|jgi:hypothetical protein